MREIKFRQFIGGTMSYWGFIENGFLGPSANGALAENAHNTPQMQFTGLRDKNGKEIYEGDIVDLPITDTCAGGGCCRKYIEGKNGSSGHMRCLVEWDAPRFYINPHGSDKQVEIIGNIYENQELLK